MKIIGLIPNHILKLMPKEDRKPLGKAGFTTEEVTEIYCAKREKEMHNIFEDWLRLNQIPFIHARMDKKSTINNGAPDFTVMWNNRVVCIEFKMNGGKLSSDQQDFISLLGKSETDVFVCHMAAEAIEIIKRILLKVKES